MGTLGVAGPEVRARNVGVEHDLSEFPPVDDRSGSPKKIAPGISGKVKSSRILQIAFIYKRFWRGISVALAEDSGSRSGRGQLGAGNGAGGGGRKIRTWARNVGVEHGLSTSCVFLILPDFPDFGSRKGPKKDPLGSLKMIKKRWCREGFGAFGNPYRFGLTFPCSKTFSRPTFLHFSGFLRGTFFQPGRGEKSSAQKVAQMSHETLAWPSEIDFEI